MMSPTAKQTFQRFQRWMRDQALQYRASIMPQQFDGTLETYHLNLRVAMGHLQQAIHWRNESRKAAKLT